MVVALEFMTLLLVLVLVPVVIGTSLAAHRARRMIGPTRAEDLTSSRPLRIAFGFLVLAIATWLAIAHDVPLFVPFFALYVAWAIVQRSPGQHDAVLGEHGVRRGWIATRFEDLAEWRLTGSHLRFRTTGEWTAVPAPIALQEELRAKLVRLAGDRESRFQD